MLMPESGVKNAGHMPHLRLVVTIAALLTLPGAGLEARGGIAFHYTSPLTAEELQWYSRFDVLVTHDPLPLEQIDALHRAGTRLVLYEWAVAWYGSLATLWHGRLPAHAALNARPLRGHLGAADADAFYYDPATREHQRDRARVLARRLRALRYDGIFLDTTTSDSVHPDALAEYRRRHPELPYDAAFARFLETLRAELRGGLIVTNQGYRHADDVLPYVDWDVSESLITHPRDGKFVLRPWDDPRDPWNSIAFLMRNLIEPVRKRFPRVRFAHINYVDDVSFVDEIVAISRLFDAQPVVALRDVAATVQSELLVYDFGKPLSGGASHRFFEHGFVAWNPSAKPLRVRNRGETIVVPPRSAKIVRRGR
jgi:hypothetical protein